MKPIGTRHFQWGTWVVPALAGIALLVLPAMAADRRVLCEEFTSVT